MKRTGSRNVVAPATRRPGASDSALGVKDTPRPTWVIAFSFASWYGCSLFTLFLNKRLLTEMHVPVHYLGMGQMCTTCFLGAVKVYGPRLLGKGDGALKRDAGEQRDASRAFYRNLALVGFMRGLTVVLGLVSLKHVAASFTEAIKSSAPLFTVIFAFLILRVRTSVRVMLSLIPVMLGLVVTSGTELSFEMVGFLAALSTNCIDCVQNVFSKRLMQEDLSPVQLQFYTSAAAITMQLPLMIYLHWGHLVAEGSNFPFHVFLLLGVACVFYHMQSVSAYYCVDCVSPVTMSVANTLKRGLLIVASIWYFGNPITYTTAAGSMLIIAGVGLYNRVRQGEAAMLKARERASAAEQATMARRAEP